MKAKDLLTLAAVVLALAGSPVWAQKTDDPVATLDVPAMTDEQIAVAAENLRKEGPAGLKRAQQAYFGWMIRCSTGLGDGTDPVDQDARWRRLIDLTAQQKDADVSGLFWYTDWESAQAEAKRTGKPVLRLFMMGRLTDNLSCANSRFFRVALYGNAEISKRLRENYVLCWTSVRPVPVITVDYGDGRKLERTVTGNSIHYIVSPDGQLIDVMPGLVGPRTFLSWLADGETKHAITADSNIADRRAQLRAYHAAELNSIASSWRVMRAKLYGEASVAPPGVPTAEAAPASLDWDAPPQVSVPPSEASAAIPPPVAPTALNAAPIAASKAFVEFPLVTEIVDAGPRRELPPQPATPNSSPDNVTVPAAAPIVPTALDAAPISRSKGAVERPLIAQVVPAAAPVTPAAPVDEPTPEPSATTPTAVEAAPLAASKRRVEAPLVNSVVAPDPNAVLAAAVGKSEVEAPLVTELNPPHPADPPVAATEPVPPATASDAAPEASRLPIAADALRLAVSKSGVERPLVRTLVGREEMPRQVAATTDAEWDRLAEFFAEASQLDDTSINLMHRLHRDPEAPTEDTCPTSTIESFENSIALDTARNIYMHRRAILEWIEAEGLPTDLVAFNERVYGELFLTPSSDPWIGLVPDGVFTGIEREGLFGN